MAQRAELLGLRAVLRVMKPQGSGAIVHTASMAALRGGPTNAPYVASKQDLTVQLKPDEAAHISGSLHLIDGAVNA